MKNEKEENVESINAYCGDQKEICIICRTEVCLWTTSPCHHNICCDGCFLRLKRVPGYEKCSLCRAQVESYSKEQDNKTKTTILVSVLNQENDALFRLQKEKEDEIEEKEIIEAEFNIDSDDISTLTTSTSEEDKYSDVGSNTDEPEIESPISETTITTTTPDASIFIDTTDNIVNAINPATNINSTSSTDNTTTTTTTNTISSALPENATQHPQNRNNNNHDTTTESKRRFIHRARNRISRRKRNRHNTQEIDLTHHELHDNYDDLDDDVPTLTVEEICESIPDAEEDEKKMIISIIRTQEKANRDYIPGEESEEEEDDENSQHHESEPGNDKENEDENSSDSDDCSEDIVVTQEELDDLLDNTPRKKRKTN